MKMKHKSVRLTLATFTAVIVSMLMLSAPASATSYGDCTLGNVCLYKDTGGGGGIKLYGGHEDQYTGNFLNCTWNPAVGCAVDNNASSVYNHGSSSNVMLYSSASYGGSNFSATRGWAYNLSAVGFNDVATSHKWY